MKKRRPPAEPEAAAPAEVILTHVGADFDGLASMLCAQKLYPSAHPVLVGAPEPMVREFLAVHRDHFQVPVARAVDRMPLRRVVLVDVQVPSRLGEFRDRVSDPRVEVHVYDHHPPTRESIRGDLYCVEEVGATTTLLVRRLMEKGAAAPTLTPLEASLFTLGIYEETGSLTFPDTTPADVRAVAWLLERGARLQLVSDFLHHTLAREQRELLNRLLAAAQEVPWKGMQILISVAELDEYMPELAGLAHRMMDLERPDALFCVVRMKQRVYVVARAREGGPDVGALMAWLGGGGHPRAASASVRGRSAAEVRDELIRLLEMHAEAPLTAGKIMSSPVQVVDVPAEGPAPSIAEAREQLARYGHNTLPVTRDGRLLGLLARRAVDKAIQHGLGDAPVTAYLAPVEAQAAPDTPLAEVQRLFADERTGRVAVVDGERLVGIITRSDLLGALYASLDQRGDGSETMDRIRALPARLQELLLRSGEVGDELGVAVYAVGGFVRDILLGVENLDFDVVVEGDGIAFAQRLAERLGGRCRAHEKFQTAVVVLSDGWKIDVASTRLEFYTRPAALPDVVGSTLKQDLWRRDFTINAMAIQLNPGRFGTLYDFFGARRDLRDRIVRVLHSLSFIDDPTRIFRAIKFEQRYYFRMDPHTEQLARQAIAESRLEQLSAKRIREEFIQILDEARPVPAILRMDELHVLRLIHPHLKVTVRTGHLLDQVTATLAQYEPLVAAERLDRWVIYFRALINALTEAEMEDVAVRYRIPTEKRRRMFLPRSHVMHLMRRLYRHQVLPSEIHRLLAPLPLEMVLYLLARAQARPMKERIMHYLDGLRQVKPLVTGRQLAAWGMAPGPAMGRQLERLFAAQIDGKIRTAAEARAWLEEEDIVALWT